MAKDGTAGTDNRSGKRVARLEKQLRTAARDAARRRRQLEKADEKVGAIAARLLAATEGAPAAVARQARERVTELGIELTEDGSGILSRAAGVAAGAAGMAAGAAGLAAGVAGKAVGLVADATTTLTRRDEASNGSGASPSAPPAPRRTRRTQPPRATS